MSSASAGKSDAQKLNTPHGKILRLDANGNNSANGQYAIPADNPFVGMPGVLAEIFAFCVHNPYRFSFDSATGNLYVGDVGQNDIEEVDLVVKGGNYGWNAKESPGAQSRSVTVTAPSRPPPQVR